MMAYLVIGACFLAGFFLASLYFGNILDYAIEKSEKRGVWNGPWKTHLGVGRKETPVIEKAAIARIGLGANSADETIYWNAFTDNDGKNLHSENEYEIVFYSDPLVNYDCKGFWSITIYGKDKFLVPNPDYKYMIRSDQKLELKNGQKFSVFLSRKKPADPKNWLPLPQKDENFTIAFRCYIPEEEMKNNARTIRMPYILKI